MMRAMAFAGCQTEPQGGRSMNLASWRFARLCHRHGKLKSTMPQQVHLLTDTDEP